MINLEQNKTNNIIIRFGHTLSNPVFLFAAKKILTCKEKSFIAQNISLNSDYKEFNINVIITGAEDLLNGKISLESSGFYILEIYEQTSLTNLNKTLATKLYEEKLDVISDIICN